MPRKHRNYGKGEPHSEYNYHASEEQKANRVARNRARREAEREGRIEKGSSKEIDHIRPLSKGGSKDSKKNTRVVSREVNRKKYDK